MEGPNEQPELEHLERLMQHPSGNRDKILHAVRDLAQHEPLSPKLRELLNKASIQILPEDLAGLLKKFNLTPYYSLLVANSVLTIEDAKEYIQEEDNVLKKHLSRTAFKKLKKGLEGYSKVGADKAINDVFQYQSMNNNNPDQSSLNHNLVSSESRVKLDIHPLQPTEVVDSAKSRRFIFGKRTDCVNKTVLLIGETGAGKSTLINSLANFIMGVQWEDSFRYQLVVDPVIGTQAQSQTKKITIYEFTENPMMPIPYALTIIDTPGYMDTEDRQVDSETTEAIRQLFQEDMFIRGQLDCVGFVIRAGVARLTPSQKYIFNSVMNLFGRDIGENINFFLTFSDVQTPPVLQVIKASQLPFLCQRGEDIPHFKFNNSGFLERSCVSDQISKMFWDQGVGNFQHFFAGLTQMQPKPLRLTNEVLKERQHLELVVSHLKSSIEDQLQRLEETTPARDRRPAVAYYKDELSMSFLCEVFKMTESQKRLNDIALQPNSINSPVEYINELIRREESSKQPGCKKRITILKRMMNQASALSEPDTMRLQFLQLNQNLKDLDQLVSQPADHLKEMVRNDPAVLEETLRLFEQLGLKVKSIARPVPLNSSASSGLSDGWVVFESHIESQCQTASFDQHSHRANQSMAIEMEQSDRKQSKWKCIVM